MTQLTERILARYVGTGVKMRTYEYGKLTYEGILAGNTIDFIGQLGKENKKYTFKLILRPLSDLTKPIVHDGSDPFVPIQRLYELRYGLLGTNRKYQIVQNNCYVSCREVGTVLELTVRIDNDINCEPFYIGYNEYDTMKQLHYWHFDTGLDKDLWIDINTLTKEQNGTT